MVSVTFCSAKLRDFPLVLKLLSMEASFRVGGEGQRVNGKGPLRQH